MDVVVVGSGLIAIGMVVWLVVAAVGVREGRGVPQGPALNDDELLRRDYSSGAISREEYERRLQQRRIP